MPRPSDLGSHTSGLGKQPPRPNEKDARGLNKKVRGTPDRPLASCGGSGAPSAPKTRISDPSPHSYIQKKATKRAPSPLRSKGSKAGPSRVSTAAPGQKSQGQLWASPYLAMARASDRSGCPKSCPRPSREFSEWDPTVGRRRAPGANRTALGPNREALWYFWSASLDR